MHMPSPVVGTSRSTRYNVNYTLQEIKLHDKATMTSPFQCLGMSKDQNRTVTCKKPPFWHTDYREQLVASTKWREDEQLQLRIWRAGKHGYSSAWIRKRYITWVSALVKSYCIVPETSRMLE